MENALRINKYKTLHTLIRVNIKESEVIKYEVYNDTHQMII